MPSPDFTALRRNMVDTQLRTYDVTSHRLLDVIERVPREIFVPEDFRELAYTDQEMVVSAGEGAARALLTPMVLARLLQALEIKTGDRALDCAGGSGYGAALMASLGAGVTAIEDSEEMCALMRERLKAAGMPQVDVVSGKIDAGAAASAPFDVILVHGSAETAPAALLDQLADGGRLGVIMGRGRAGRATVYTRNNGIVGSHAVFDAAARPVGEFSRTAGFTF